MTKSVGGTRGAAFNRPTARTPTRTPICNLFTHPFSTQLANSARVIHLVGGSLYAKLKPRRGCLACSKMRLEGWLPGAGDCDCSSPRTSVSVANFCENATSPKNFPCTLADPVPQAVRADESALIDI